MEKVTYNLLTAATTAPIALSSTNGVDTFTGPIVPSESATNALLYVGVQGFGTSDIGVNEIQLKIWESYMGGPTADWFLHTAFAAYSTAVHDVAKLTDLGKFVRLSYDVGAATVAAVRINLEVHNEYDIDSLGHY